MNYFVTGATGFLGRNLIPLLAARGGTIHVLVRESSLAKFEELRRSWGTAGAQVEPVVGDLGQPMLGVGDEDRARLKGVEHFFHLAALYDMESSAEAMLEANVAGTRHAMELAEDLEAGCFHHTSSIAAAGRFRGIFREDMFEEAEGLEDPYFRTKHESEGLVRRECRRPWRISRTRPGSR